MKNNRQGRTWSRRITVLLAALTAAVLLAIPAAAATCTASDVMIRNSGEEKDNNIIGVLNEGDQVTVRSKTVDSAGIEWYYVELPNGNTGYVKSQWIDNGGNEVETVQQSAEDSEEETEPETAEAEDAGETEEEQADEGDFDDWTEEDADMLAGTPVAAGSSGVSAEADDEGAAQSQETPDVDNGQSYDPYTDPNAQYSINFVTESDGTGNWYIYNYDTDKRIRVGDLEKLSDAQNAAQKSASSAALWRTAACVFLILLIALIVFLYLSGRRDGGGPGRRGSRKRARRTREDEDEDEYDEFSWDSGDEEEEDAEPTLDQSSLASAKEDEDEDGGGPDDGEYEDPDDDEDYGDGDHYEDEDDYGDEDDYEDDAESRGPSRRSGVFSFLKNIFSPADVDDYDEEYDDEGEYGEDDTAEDEEYSADLYGDEDVEEDEDEEEAPVRRRSSRKASSRRSAPRPRKRPARTIEFDEESDYPEDAELLSFAGPVAAAAEEDEEAVTEEAPETEYRAENTRPAAKEAAPAGRKSAVAGDRPAAAAKTQKAAFVPAEDIDDDFFADEDDDMDYSFLAGSSHRKKS